MRRAQEILANAVCDRGFLACANDVSNYRRVWTRDAVVCGIAASLHQDDALIDALGLSLRHLSSAQGPHGEVPSSIAAEGEASPSYGHLAGRVDCGAWLVIGAVHYLRARPDSNLREALARSAAQVFARYEVLEQNGRGLIYSPLGGDWCDDYDLDGYSLTPNLLRLWALELAADEFADVGGAAVDKAARLRELIELNYWIDDGAATDSRYHPRAYAREQGDSDLPYWRATLTPAGYSRRFDGLGNALAVLLGVGNQTHRAAAASFLDDAQLHTASGLIPAFWPPISEGEADWTRLRNMAGLEFRNLPGHYHNGGAWPMVNGFCVAALMRQGRAQSARELHARVHRCNSGERPYPEYLVASDGQSAGVSPCTWSAAGELIAEAALGGRLPLPGTAVSSGREKR